MMTLRRLLRFFISLGMLLMTAATWAAPTIPQEVIDTVLNNEETRVLVGIKVNWQPEGLLGNASAVVAQRNAIAQTQQTVKDNLVTGLAAQGIDDTSSVFNSMVLFETVPYMAMMVDRITLSLLNQDDNVTSIMLDKVEDVALQESLPAIKIPQVHQQNYTGKNYYIAVLDTGVDDRHPMLLGKVKNGACFSTTYKEYDGLFGTHIVKARSLCPNFLRTEEEGEYEQIGAGAAKPCPGGISQCDHGTHVAGIASSTAPDAKIIPVQVFSDFSGTARSQVSDQVRGLDWLHTEYGYGGSPLVAVNMSLGGGKYTKDNCDIVGNESDALLNHKNARKAIIANLASVGIPVIAAAGNQGYNGEMNSPACLENVISVGATDKQGNLWQNSNRPADLYAPGKNIVSALPGGQTGSKDGTSQAAPHVAAAFAVLKEAKPDASSEKIFQILQDSSHPMISLDEAAEKLTEDDTTGGTDESPLDVGSFKFKDLNANGQKEVNEPGLAGEIVYVRNNMLANQGVIDATYKVRTDSDGRYSFNAPNSGSYTVWTYIPDDMKQTTPIVGSGMQPYTLNLAAGDALGLSFGIIDIDVEDEDIENSFSLTVSKQGQGSISGENLTCGTNCTAEYSEGKTITLTATPADGQKFVKWRGDCAGQTSTTTVQMDADRTCTAHFESLPTTFRLSLSKQGQGNISGENLACGTSCSADYEKGQSVTLKATPVEGHKFVKWSGDCSGEESELSVDMNADYACIAHFEPLPTSVHLSLNKGGDGMGSITVKLLDTGEKIRCRYDCTTKIIEALNPNQKVHLSIYSYGSSEFIQWAGDCSGTNPGIYLTLDEAKECTAIFELPAVPKPGMSRLTVQVIGTGEGLVKGSYIHCGSNCINDYDNGKKIVIRAYPKDGFAKFTGWSGDCEEFGTKERITFPIDKNMICQAEFENLIIEPSNELVRAFYENGEIDQQEVNAQYPVALNEQRLEEAFGFAMLAIKYIESHLKTTGEFPIHLNGKNWYNTDDYIGHYTKNIKFVANEDMGQYLDIQVKLVNAEGEEKLSSVLMYYGAKPDEGAIGGDGSGGRWGIFYFPYWW